jgi:long-subunit acyl-CoA synthetase (AMP-forming)
MIPLLFESLRAAGAASDIVLQTADGDVSRAALLQRAEDLALELQRMNITRVALHADNGLAWVLSELACQHAGLTVVPLPLFFSDEQLRHALASSGVDAVISDCDLVMSVPEAEPVAVPNELLAGTARIYRLQPDQSAKLPPGTQKITFTSGSTGTPKGVCLSAEQQFAVANSLASVIDIDKPTHLCVLPLSTLLENLAGLYAPMLAGGKIIAAPLSEIGLSGSSGLELGKLLACIGHYQPSSLILVPEILSALVLAAAAGWQPPASLQFVAVGGGKVSADLLRDAREAGIPAYEGYGLSECSSVVSLNVPGADQVGAVGRPLPHVEVTTVSGEIVVSGSTFLGYANQPDSWGADCVRTGDLGHIDQDGFIHVDGRLKHQLISSYGRNLSPEWVESELLGGPMLQQAIVFGDDRPYCVALVYPHNSSSSDQEISAWIDKVNHGLPDYARVSRWYRLPKALSSRDGLLTDNARPKRANIEQTYQLAISDLYEMHQEVSNL